MMTDRQTGRHIKTETEEETERDRQKDTETKHTEIHIERG